MRLLRVRGRTLAQRILSACAYSGITAVIIAVLYGFAYGAQPAALPQMLLACPLVPCPSLTTAPAVMVSHGETTMAERRV